MPESLARQSVCLMELLLYTKVVNGSYKIWPVGTVMSSISWLLLLWGMAFLGNTLLSIRFFTMSNHSLVMLRSWKHCGNFSDRQAINSIHLIIPCKNIKQTVSLFVAWLVVFHLKDKTKCCISPVWHCFCSLRISHLLPHTGIISSSHCLKVRIWVNMSPELWSEVGIVLSCLTYLLNVVNFCSADASNVAATRI